MFVKIVFQQCCWSQNSIRSWLDLIQTNESIDKKRKKIEKWYTWLWRIRERGRKRENRCFYSSTIVRNWRRARSRRHLLRNSSITAGGAIFTSGKEQWWIREGRRKKERKKFVLKMFRGGKGRLFPRGIEVKANKIREWNSPRLLFLRIRFLGSNIEITGERNFRVFSSIFESISFNECCETCWKILPRKFYPQIYLVFRNL